ncbi:MAG: ATP-binding protein [Leptospirales bacterium]|nr:ATP-binding protein [Leptospirales bacterium]
MRTRSRLLLTFLILILAISLPGLATSFANRTAASSISRTILLVLPAFTLAIACILVWFAWRDVLGTLLKLHESARAIARGDFAIATMSRAQDEFGDFARTFDNMRVDLAQATLAIHEVDDDRAVTRERYKVLFESTHDLIFSMKPNLQITNANPAAHQVLGLARDTLPGKNFFDIIFLDPARSMAPVLLMGELAHFIERRAPMARRISFVRADGTETAEFDVRLEFLNIQGSDEVTARAVPILVDPLVPSLVSETLEFNLESDILLVDNLANRISRNLLRYADEDATFGMSLGVREMLINAIEHGNLGITYEEKTQAMQSDKYMQLLRERTRDTRFSRRRVKIEYAMSAKEVTYNITDEGDGFDHKALKERGMPDTGASHGRGILITNDIFDEMIYNEKGNSVYLVKRFSEQGK